MTNTTKMKQTKISKKAINSAHSRWIEHCNETHNWEPIGGDNAEAFEKKYNKAIKNSALPRFIEEMETYKNHPLTYRINNYGFRGEDDFNDKDEYTVFLGCSHTVGVGHYFENTWAYKMMNWLDDGSKMANLSNGGNGIASGYRYLLKFKDIIKIKRIFLFFPHWFRYEFNKGFNHYRTYTPYDGEWNPGENGPTGEWGEKGWRRLTESLINFNHHWHHYHTNALAIYSIAKELNIPLYFSSYFDKEYREPVYDNSMFYARDLHSSSWVYNAIFKMFQDKVQNNEVADLNYIQNNMLTRRTTGDETLMDVTNEGILLNPPFESPSFAIPSPLTSK